MDMKKVVRLFSQELQAVETVIERNLQAEVGLIYEVGKYLLLSGGKRIRPLLLLLVSELCHYRGDRRYILAAALEFIHTATLLHDDVIDNSYLRRGYPSANARWGNEVSILVGDFLYAKAMAMALEDNDNRVLQEITQVTMAMTEGQILETLKLWDLTINEEEYYQIISRKTASLFAACCYIGAVIGEASPQQTSALRSFGLNLGIAFQMIDDTLDFAAQEQRLGKPVGRDLREGKITLPLILALREMTSKEYQFIEMFTHAKEKTDEDFLHIIAILQRYDILNRIRAEAETYTARAKDALQVFESSMLAKLLIELADYVVQRDN